MPALREVFASFGVSFDSRALVNGARSVQAMTQRVMGLGNVLMGGYLARGLIRFVTGQMDAARQIRRSAIMLNMSTDEFQAWGYAARQSGVEAATFSRGAMLMMRNVAQAARGQGAARDDFRRLGIEVRNTDGSLKTAAQMMDEVAGAANRLQTSGERTDLAMALFGRGGLEMVPMLRGGADGLAALREEFQRLGGGIPQELITRSSEFARTQRRFQLSMQSLRSTLALTFLPTFVRVMETISQFVTTIRNSPAAMRRLEQAIRSVGLLTAAVTAVMAIEWLTATWPVLVLAAGVAALYLILEDLWVALHGGESAFGDIVDRLLPGMIGGFSQAEMVVLQFMDSLYRLASAAQGAGNIIAAAFEMMLFPINAVIDAINAVMAIAGGANVGRTAMAFGGQVIGRGGGIAGRLGRGREQMMSVLGRGENPVSGIIRAATHQEGHLRGGAPIRAESKVDARAFFNVTVNGATDAEEVDRRVRSVMLEENRRQIRQIRAATVYDYSGGRTR